MRSGRRPFPSHLRVFRCYPSSAQASCTSGTVYSLSFFLPTSQHCSLFSASLGPAFLIFLPHSSSCGSRPASAPSPALPSSPHGPTYRVVWGKHLLFLLGCFLSFLVVSSLECFGIFRIRAELRWTQYGEQGPWSQTHQAVILAQSHCCVTSGKSLNFSETSIPIYRKGQ